MLRLIQWLVGRTRLPPHAVSGPTLGGERLASDELLRAAALILLFLAVLVVSWLVFLAHGYDALDALFEVASATGTVGLSAGIARPDLEPLLKGVLCVDMLVGRLEIFAILVALSPRTWIGRRAY
jgi:trk system potassium uptake protein TrkH